MSIKSKYPALRPSLLLDFVNSRSVDPRITVTRSSAAARRNEKGQIETIAANIPRIDFDPVTGACKGLLVEEQRTNLLTYSDQIENSAWAKGSNAIFATEGTSPINGVSPYYSMRSNGTAGNLYVSRSFTAPTSGDYVLTSWLMTDNETLVASAMRLMSINLGADSTRHITFAGAGLTVGQWKLVAFKFSLTAGDSVTFFFGFDFGINTNAKLYFCHPQVEAGSSPTSYIPTAGAAVTRAAEVPLMTGTNFSSWYRQDEGAFVVFARRDSLSAGRLITLSDGTANNQIRISIVVSATSLRADLEVVTGGVSQVSTITTPVFSVGSVVAIAFAYKANDFAISVNGSTAVTGASGAVPPVDRTHIGTDHAGASSHNGTAARIAYYPKRPSNAELQALTTL